MNTKDLIKEAAEAYYADNYKSFDCPAERTEFADKINFVLTHAKEKHQMELVRVEATQLLCDQLKAENEQLKKELANKDRVIAEWVELWEPINEAIENCPTLKLGDSKSQKAVEIIEWFNAATTREK